MKQKINTYFIFTDDEKQKAKICEKLVYAVATQLKAGIKNDKI